MRVYKVILISLLIVTSNRIHSQIPSGAYLYRVTFTDKGSQNIANFPLSSLVTARAVNRREKADMGETDFFDLPVSPDYLNQIMATGVGIHSSSRWMNSALIYMDDPIYISAIESLACVKEIKLVKEPGLKSKKDKFLAMEGAAYWPNYWPVKQLNAIPLHQAGYTGNGILIAVLDAGFANANVVTSLEPLRNRQGIIYTENILTGESDVYGFHQHGTAVLTTLAGQIPNLLMGSAPGAEYILLRSEDAQTEYPVEEDYWVIAAEKADSLGADIISSSLGYTEFDNPGMSYSYSDLDGNTAFITKASNIAHSRNILVVNSAGNSRNDPWLYINAPSDAEGVLSVGAVDYTGMISLFSSAGPTSDGRIKPDIVAGGVAIPLQTDSEIRYLNGTSFSCPIISGLAACLMQSNPEATAPEIMSVIKNSGNRALRPDTLYGNGIPNMVLAFSILNQANNTFEGSVTAHPNPSGSFLILQFRNAPGTISLKVYSADGRLLYYKEIPGITENFLEMKEFGSLPNGLLLFRIEGPGIRETIKVVKQ